LPLPDRAAVAGNLSWLLAVLNTSWLPEDLMMKVDKMTMAVGLEARTPYLDHRLVESMARLPDRYKVRGTGSKFLLRRLAAELLPPQVAGRRKQGFNVPLGTWFRGELRPLLMDALASRAVKQAGLIDARVARRIAAAHLDGRGDYGRQLWTILCYQLWYERFMGGRAAERPLGAVAATV
jgi:asparagine synthase (glutamine-hydrolysing)